LRRDDGEVQQGCSWYMVMFQHSQCGTSQVVPH
jgi:hypothetical protein